MFEDEALTLVLDPERFDATRLPPSIIESLIGAVAGGALDFSVTYPAFWPDAALQEQGVAFTGTVARIVNPSGSSPRSWPRCRAATNETARTRSNSCCR